LHALHSKHVLLIAPALRVLSNLGSRSITHRIHCAGTCLQELAVDDILYLREDPDEWKPSTFTLKKGTSVFVLPPGTATRFWRRWQT
jgi:hypothetical protein